MKILSFEEMERAASAGPNRGYAHQRPPLSHLPGRGFETAPRPKLRVMFLVEGFTDIRFVKGLSGVCDLTMIVPEREYRASGLEERVAELHLPLTVCRVKGGRCAFQVRAFLSLWRSAHAFDLILAQEALRGALDANLVGLLRRIPVVTYLGYPPLEYFRCRRERRQIGWLRAGFGAALIGVLLRINGSMATRCLAMGPYLREVAARYSRRSALGLYYGVDTRLFCPATAADRTALRQRLNLPQDKFVVVLSSRVSHEKDPETTLRAVRLAREQGLDAVLLNLGGGWRDFLALARNMGLPHCDQWVLARPALNPLSELQDYFRAADALALASLAEGAAFSTLEALACGTPVVATAVGGMARQLTGYARLAPRCDSAAMARELLWVAANPAAARDQALGGRDYVTREWDSRKAFADLESFLTEIAGRGRR